MPGSTPTDILITNAQITETAGPGRVVGTLSAIDPDVGDTFTYELVSESTGGQASTLFEIVDGIVHLQGAAVLDYETATQHELLVRVTDQDGNTFEKQLTVSVTDANEIAGTAGDDTGPTELNGSASEDVIDALQGNDTIDADAGDDLVYGGDGNDTIDAGNGLNTVYGGDGTDSITGGAQADQVYGGAGADTINGGDGDDILDSGGGGGTMYGGAGADTMTVGGQANDPAETIYGGNGNDIISSFVGRADTIDAGADDDTVLVLNLRGSAATVTLGSGHDTIILLGPGGDPTGYGIQAIVTDFVPGTGAEADTINFDDLVTNGLVDLNGGNPFQTGHLRLFQDGADTLLQMDVNGATGGADYLTILVLKNTTATALTSTNFFPVFDPGNGSGLTGTSAAETLTGTGADDIITGNGGIDTLSGLAGDDTFVFSSGDLTPGTSINGGANTDAIELGNGTHSFAGVTVTNVEQIKLTGTGATTVTLADAAQSDLIVSTAGSNDTVILNGYLSPDQLTTLAAAGVEHVQFTNGNGTNVADFGGGKLTTITVTYDVSNTTYDSAVLTYDTSTAATFGAATQAVTTFDNSIVETATYVNGQQTQVAKVDGAGGTEFAWAQQTFTLSGGALTGLAETQDDGASAAWTYGAGGAITRYMTTQADGDTYDLNFDSTGTKLVKTISEDVSGTNGAYKTITNDFTDGVFSKSTTVFDNGLRTILNVSPTGARTSYEQHDDGKVFTYDSLVNTYSADGSTLVKSIVTQDGGGTDQYSGTTGATLTGTAFNDSMTGAAGAADTFAFTVKGGNDYVANFENGIDHLNLSGLGFADFAAFQAATTGGDTWLYVTVGSGETASHIVVNGLGLATLDASDMIL